MSPPDIAMSEYCFTYGSLMCPEIMAEAAGRPCLGEPAELPGHARHPVAGEAYPGVVEAPGSQVAGILYRDLDAAALARLDAFEGEMYERRRVEVNRVGRGRVAAWCYIVRPEFRNRLLPGDWDFEAFLAEGKRRFMADYLGFTALDRG